MDTVQKKPRSLVLGKSRGSNQTGATELPLSAEQQRFLFLERLESQNPELYLTTLIGLEGPLQTEILFDAIREIVRRHDILRSVFPADAAVGKRRVLPAMTFTPVIVDLSSHPPKEKEERWQACVDTEADANPPLDVVHGPLFRVVLVRFDTTKHELIVRFHHLATDFVSHEIFAAELAEIYASLTTARPTRLPPAPSYSEFVQWEESRLQGHNLEEQLAYWREKLAGVPAALELPTDLPRPKVHTLRAAHHKLSLPAELADRLEEAARREGVTLGILLLAALHAVLHLHSGQTDILIGAPRAARDEERFERMLGPLVSWLVYRARCSGDKTLRTLVREVSQAAIEAFSHSNLPLGKFLEVAPRRGARDQSRNPLFQVLLNFLTRTPPIRAGELTVTSKLLDWRRMHFDLAVWIERSLGNLGMSLEFIYYADIFSKKRIEEFARTYVALLEEIPANLERTLTELRSSANMGNLPLPMPTHDVEIAIASTFTAEPLAAPIEYWLENLGLVGRLSFAAFNNVFQALLNPESILAQTKRGLNVVLVRLSDWPDVERNVGDLVDALRTFSTHATAPCVVVCCPSTIPADAGKSERFDALERTIEHGCADLHGVHVVTSAALGELYPVEHCYDEDADRLGAVPYTDTMFAALATLIARRVYAAVRTPPKVLVLDADNTLWRGIVGESGAGGITLEEGHRALQQRAVALADAGILICVVSKNVEQDVLEVFESRRDEMLLRHDHVVAWRVNWKPKSENVLALARELNLGLDSFVFLDDNPLECAEVETNCPGVVVGRVPTDPAAIPQFLRHFWPLDTAAATAEDRQRTLMYKENLKRENLRREVPDYGAFLASLDLKITSHQLSDENLARASQLTQRTNQFNTTTLRRTEGELRQLSETSGWSLRLVHVRDRFGDYGLVGFTAYELVEDRARVEMLLLSCRALGRGVEHSMLREVGRVALAKGLRTVEVEFRPTKKNRPAADFLEKLATDTGDHVEVAGGTVFRFPSERLAELVFAPPTAQPDAQVEDAAPEASKMGSAAAVPIHFQRADLWERVAGELANAGTVAAAVAMKLRHDRPVLATEYVEPVTPTQKILATTWQQVLGLERVGISDNFFELGGDSLQTLQVFVKAKELGIVLDPKRILELQTIAELADEIDGKVSHGETAALPSAPEEVLAIRASSLPPGIDLVDAFPLSGIQSFMVRSYRRANQSQQRPPMGAYHFQQTMRISDPNASVEALRDAVRYQVRAYPLFRMCVVTAEDGVAAVGIRREADPDVPVFDLSAKNPVEQRAAFMSFVQADRERVFDVDRTTDSVARFAIFRISRDEVDLFMSVHHMIGDGWGYQIWLNELLDIYSRLKSGTDVVVQIRPLVYKEFVKLERETLRLGEAAKFWMGYLKGVSHVPFALRAAPGETYVEPVIRRIGRDRVEAISERSRSLHVSVKAYFLSHYLRTLERWKKVDGVTVGVITNGRSERLSDPVGSFGLFWNIAPFVDISGARAADEDRVRQVQKDLAALERYGSYPLLQILRDVAKDELFDATFNFIHFHNARWNATSGALRAEAVHCFDRFHFPLNCKVEVRADGDCEITLTYDEHYLAKEDVETFADAYASAIVAQGKGDESRLPV